MKKKLKWIFAGGVGFVIVAALVVMLFMGKIVKSGVEALAPKITGTDVAMGIVTVSPWMGKVRIRNFAVGNPEGFQSPYAIRFKDLILRMDTSSIFSDKVVIDRLLIEAPELSHETTQGGNNLKRIQHNVDRFSRQVSQVAGGEKEEKPSKPKKFLVRDLTISDAKVHWTPRMVKKTVTLDIPDVQMKNIGEKTGGVSASELSSRVLRSLTGNIGTAIAKSSKAVTEGLKKSANDVKGKLKKLIGN